VGVSGNSWQYLIEVGVDAPIPLSRIDDSIYYHVHGRGVCSAEYCLGSRGGPMVALRIPCGRKPKRERRLMSWSSFIRVPFLERTGIVAGYWLSCRGEESVALG
jgi:hypothetical protein